MASTIQTNSKIQTRREKDDFFDFVNVTFVLVTVSIYELLFKAKNYSILPHFRLNNIGASGYDKGIVIKKGSTQIGYSSLI